MMVLEDIGSRDNFAIPGVTKSATVDEIKFSQQAQVVKVQEALEVMHKQSNRFNTSLRAVARTEHAKKKGTNTEQFDIGGFMLNADVWHHTRSKFSCKWCGFVQVGDTMSNWIVVILNLIMGQNKKIPATRLKFYADNPLNVSEDLLLRIVDILQEVRYNNEKTYEIKVYWRCLSKLEDF
ncbi:hypothetical protein PHMEG_00024877 [Phytophthora megakarya]|uniref:Uncharacterized protein n=1 Tax=Phytophthora megakarya TaxID=4795 RepID=A0A225VEM8_9STRA|nr:hypothetical protein PHMEG_00024877 [Phytophthora megakarya]